MRCTRKISQLSCLLLICGGAFCAAEGQLTLPAADFVGGCHSTYRRERGADFTEEYRHRAARKVSIFSRGVEGDSATARFDLNQGPARDAMLDVVGLDDVNEGAVPIRITVNDTVVHEGRTTFKDSPHIYVPRGWTTQSFAVPAQAFAKGENALTIENLDDGYDDTLRWMFVHKAVFRFAENAVDGTVKPGEDFLGRQYLNGNVEPVVYPAALKQNVIHLIRGRFLQQGVTAMADSTYNGKDVHAVVDIPQGIEARVVRGEELGRERVARGGVAYQRVTLSLTLKTTPGRRIYFAGYPLVALKPNTGGEVPPVHVQYVVDGEEHPGKTFPVRVWGAEAHPDRPDGFSLGVWGAGRPDDAAVAEDFGQLLSGNGFQLVFGTTNKEEADFFQGFGIKYYPRFGPHHPSDEHPSINWDGTPNPRRADPIHLIYDKEAVKLPTFQRAIEAAKKDWVDGVCCDYELLADSWSDRAIAEFKRFRPRFAKHTKEELRQMATDPETGQYRPFPEWMNFRRWLNARIVGRIQREMQAIRPGLPYLSLASATDMPCYWWDAAGRGRFRLRDLVTQVDQVACSVYHYDNPGGLPSIPAIVETAERFALGYDTEMHLIGIFSGTLIELYRYDGARLPGWAMRLDILLAGAAGGDAFHYFRGDQLDGEYFSMASRALHELAQLEPLLEQGERTASTLTASLAEKPEYTLPRSANHTFGAKLLWAGSPERQTTSMFRVLPDGKLLVLLFNFMNVPAPLNVVISGEAASGDYQVSDVLGTAHEAADHAPVSPAKGFLQTVPPRDVSALVLTPAAP